LKISVIKFEIDEIKLVISANIFRYPKRIADILISQIKYKYLYVYLKISLKELQISEINCRYL